MLSFLVYLVILLIRMDWIDVLINFCIAIFTVSLTIGCAFFIYKKEKGDCERKEFGNFKRLFSALISEINDNLAMLKHYQRDITTTNISHFQLSIEIISKILSNELSYKYLGEEHILALRKVILKNKENNNFLKILIDIGYNETTIPEEYINDFQLNVSKTKYYSLILQDLNQILQNVIEIRWGGASTSEKKEFMKVLNYKLPDSIEEVEQENNILEEDILLQKRISEEDREKSKEMYKKVLKRQEKRDLRDFII